MSPLNLDYFLEPDGDKARQLVMEHEHQRFGGKEAYDAYWEAYRAEIVPAPPNLIERLAREWAIEQGRDWGAMSEPQRARWVNEMGVAFARAVSPSINHPA